MYRYEGIRRAVLTAGAAARNYITAHGLRARWCGKANAYETPDGDDLHRLCVQRKATKDRGIPTPMKKTAGLIRDIFSAPGFFCGMTLSSTSTDAKYLELAGVLPKPCRHDGVSASDFGLSVYGLSNAAQK
jgi:hypothetical protein